MRRFQPLLNMLGSNIIPLAKWKEVRVVDRATKNHELKIKEPLCKQMTHDNNKFNRDVGLEIPRCWLFMLRSYHPSGYNKL